jgi:UDP-N-acetylglucosamine 1-carboxyvinyltransferase
VTVADARREHMETLLRKLSAIGCEVSGEIGLTAKGPARPNACDIATLPYPGVATDYKPLLVAVLATAEGTSVVTENLFEGRFRYLDELARLGAQVRTEGHHVVINGVPRLTGASVRATDLRAGSSLVLAGLVADGETQVANAEHVDRGYEDFDGTLRSLGADVVRA